MGFPVSPAQVLILDDADGCRAAFSLLVQDLWPEAHCLEAATLGDAARLLASTSIDLVCADLRLPDSMPATTLDTLARLLDPEVPLVLISGSSFPLDGYDLLRRGADAFCSKGMDTHEMQQRIYMAWAASYGRRKRHALWAGV